MLLLVEHRAPVVEDIAVHRLDLVPEGLAPPPGVSDKAAAVAAALRHGLIE